MLFTDKTHSRALNTHKNGALIIRALDTRNKVTVNIIVD